jgi:hypothetical protein
LEFHCIDYSDRVPAVLRCSLLEQEQNSQQQEQNSRLVSS